MNSSLILHRSTMIRGNGVGTAACRRFQSRTKDCGMIHSTSNMSRDLGLSACPLAIRGSSTQKTDPHGHRPNSAQLLDAPGRRASQAILQPTSSHTIIPNSRYDPPPPPPHVKHSPHVEPSPKDPCSGQNPPLRIPTGLPNITISFQTLHPSLPSPATLTPLTTTRLAHLFFLPPAYYNNPTPSTIVDYNSSPEYVTPMFPQHHLAPHTLEWRRSGHLSPPFPRLPRHPDTLHQKPRGLPQ